MHNYHLETLSFCKCWVMMEIPFGKPSESMSEPCYQLAQSQVRCCAHAFGSYLYKQVDRQRSTEMASAVNEEIVRLLCPYGCNNGVLPSNVKETAMSEVQNNETSDRSSRDWTRKLPTNGSKKDWKLRVAASVKCGKKITIRIQLRILSYVMRSATVTSIVLELWLLLRVLECTVF